MRLVELSPRGRKWWYVFGLKSAEIGGLFNNFIIQLSTAILISLFNIGFYSFLSQSNSLSYFLKPDWTLLYISYLLIKFQLANSNTCQDPARKHKVTSLIHLQAKFWSYLCIRLYKNVLYNNFHETKQILYQDLHRKLIKPVRLHILHHFYVIHLLYCVKIVCLPFFSILINYPLSFSLKTAKNTAKTLSMRLLAAISQLTWILAFLPCINSHI